MATSVTAICGLCAREHSGKPRKDGTAKLPTGWHDHAGQRWCSKCWAKSWTLRSIVLPIAEPLDCTRAELREALRAAWADSTLLSNWMLRELYLRDVRRGPGDDKKMPAMRPQYLYPEARKVAPQADPQSVVAIEQAVTRKYRQRRYSIVWTQSESLPNYRYPAPYPVHNQSWSAQHGPDGEPIVSVRLRGKRIRLRLRGGSQYRRQLGMFRAIVDGEALGREMSFYRIRANGSDHRGEATDRENNGGPRVYWRDMCKVVAWVRKTGEREQNGTLYVRTDGDALLIYRVNDEEPRYWHADHARRLCVQRRKRQARLSHDTKAERRRPRRDGMGIRELRAQLSARFGRALDAVTHEASSIVAKYAERRGVAVVVYDDTVRTFDAQFPWFQLRERMAYKLDERKIALEVVGRKPEADSGD